MSFGRDCCQYCCQAAGQRLSRVDSCGMSAQCTDGNRWSWTTCLSLRIRRLGYSWLRVIFKITAVTLLLIRLSADVHDFGGVRDFYNFELDIQLPKSLGASY